MERIVPVLTIRRPLHGIHFNIVDTMNDYFVVNVTYDIFVVDPETKFSESSRTGEGGEIMGDIKVGASPGTMLYKNDVTNEHIATVKEMMIGTRLSKGDHLSSAYNSTADYKVFSPDPQQSLLVRNNDIMLK